MHRRRRFIVVVITALIIFGGVFLETTFFQQLPSTSEQLTTLSPESTALEVLKSLPIKGRAPKTGYSRQQFGDGWQQLGNCDIRNQVLQRDLQNVQLVSETDCTVVMGVLKDPYTNKTIDFIRGESTSSKVQIDHVVALSDAWQKGAQQLPIEQRLAFSNDPLNLLAVDGATNMQKGDGDAATWLPPHKSYRCAYVARQIAVKKKYVLWLTQAEHDAMSHVLQNCPREPLPVANIPSAHTLSLKYISTFPSGKARTFGTELGTEDVVVF